MSKATRCVGVCWLGFSGGVCVGVFARAPSQQNLTVPLDTKFMNHSIKTVLISSLVDCIETTRSEAYLPPDGELVSRNKLLVTRWIRILTKVLC